MPNQSVFEPAESQPCRITLHVSDVKEASTGAFYIRLPNPPNQESLHACRIRNCDTTLRYAKVNKLSSRPWGGSCICRTFLRNASARCALRRKLHLQNFSADCFGPMCSGEEAAFATLFCGMLWPDVLYAVMNNSPIYTPHPYTVHSPDSAVLPLAESECV